MAHFTRQSLYELVWSQPMRTVAAGLGVSDVAVAKACRKADIPVPERGYWARKRANKLTRVRHLPPRFPGASDEIEVASGRRYHWGMSWREIPLGQPLPPVPTFDEDISAVAERVRKIVGKVICPKQLNDPHRLITPFLERDEQRRAQYLKTGHSYYEPLYDSPLQRRRLRILSAVFNAVQRLACKPHMNTSEYVQERDRQPSIRVGDTTVTFNLDPVQSKRSKQGTKHNDRLRLTLGWRRDDGAPDKSWEDVERRSLEGQLTEIVVEIIVTGERWYRETQLNHHRWLVKRRADMEAEVRRKKEEADQRARELRAKQAKERVDRLVGQAHALDQSNTIRTYVKAVCERASELSMTGSDLEHWAEWALSEADRIDPVKNGTVEKAAKDLASVQAGPN
jgi:hypothetical protein